ncbi:MAG: 4-carboxy-4-hydroxy-2-oxoadipate aldolase/oxaloacetate decarboxylase [Anaerolineaceae bacterium]|nr:4-carboxy-4-hydroxy-2-oxoadipate aldolase/oxaloacetate decarboxylase [Anaerolineaceae bacterium]
MTVDELKRLSELGVATVYEASGRIGLIDIPFIQLIQGSRIAGPARTVRCAQDDNLMVHAAIEQIIPGEVLVLTMPEPAPVALIGELLVTQAKVKKAAGILVDAAVRDVEELQNLGLPIWTRFIRVKGASKNKIGELNRIVSVGGTQIAPSDIIVLDADGGVCIKQERVGEVLQASEVRFEKETRLREKLEAGEISYDLHGLRDFVEKNGRKIEP